MTSRYRLVAAIVSLVCLTAGCGPEKGDADPSDTGVSESEKPDGSEHRGSDGGGMDADGPTDAVTGSCDKTHRKVGWTAELEEKFHNVGGTAEIIDDCTIAIRNFTYDGQGIVVEIYGAATHGEYAKGYSMTDNLVRSRAYKGETLVMTLPDGKTLDDLDGVSVWCVDVGADFGSGEFTK